MITLTSESGKYDISNPEERIRCYCRLEIYEGYDDQHDINNSIAPENIRAANKLYARISKDTSSNFVKCSDLQKALSAVEDVELGGLNDNKWKEVRTAVSQLLEKAHNIHGVGLAVSTKVIHLKRPKLMPILDSYIIKLLLGRNMPQNKARLASLGVEAIDIIRTDLLSNKEAFQSLSMNLGDLPICLEIVRLYDILAWTHEKWNRLGIKSTPYRAES